MLRGMGASEFGIKAYTEMIDAVNSGWITFGVPGTEHVEGKIRGAQVFTAAKQAAEASAQT